MSERDLVLAKVNDEELGSLLSPQDKLIVR